MSWRSQVQKTFRSLNSFLPLCVNLAVSQALNQTYRSHNGGPQDGSFNLGYYIFIAHQREKRRRSGRPKRNGEKEVERAPAPRSTLENEGIKPR